MQNEEVKDLANKIARMVSAESKKTDLSAIFAALEKIDHRLDKLERPTLQIKPIHPSQERFAVAEAIADSVFELHSKEKACTFEPNGKPCDHCAMCSSRGF